VILKLANNSRLVDGELRESYRQRLNEIFESARTSSDGEEPQLVPVIPAVPSAASVDPEQPAPVWTDASIPHQAPGQPSRTPEAVLPVPASPVEEKPAGANDALGEAAERMARALTQSLVAIVDVQERRRSAEAARLEAVVGDTQKLGEELGELRDSTRTQQSLIEGQILAATSRIDACLDVLRTTLQSQAAIIAGLASTNDGLTRNQQAFQQRLDNQADVIRELTSAAAAQQDRWSQYRSAVDKLKEITDLSNLPVRLPDNL
jgi:hypothetical protein